MTCELGILNGGVLEAVPKEKRSMSCSRGTRYRQHVSNLNQSNLDRTSPDRDLPSITSRQEVRKRQEREYFRRKNHVYRHPYMYVSDANCGSFL
jgi:hypothetical protein